MCRAAILTHFRRAPLSLRSGGPYEYSRNAATTSATAAARAEEFAEEFAGKCPCQIAMMPSVSEATTTVVVGRSRPRWRREFPRCAL